MYWIYFFTVRNEVAKVMFLHVCLSTGWGGGSASVHAGIPLQDQTPPAAGSPPPPPATVADVTHPTGMQYCFRLKFLVSTCPFLGPLILLFRTSGDVSSGFQSQSGQPYCKDNLLRYIHHVILWSLCTFTSSQRGTYSCITINPFKTALSDCSFGWRFIHYSFLFCE